MVRSCAVWRCQKTPIYLILKAKSGHCALACVAKIGVLWNWVLAGGMGGVGGVQGGADVLGRSGQGTGPRFRFSSYARIHRSLWADPPEPLTGVVGPGRHGKKFRDALCRVCCRVRQSEWAPGAHRKAFLSVEEHSWPRGRVAPYQVQLDDGQHIFAPHDIDDLTAAIWTSSCA